MCHFLEYGITDYRSIYKLQKSIVNAKIEDKALSNIIIILEHFPVYTLGKNAVPNNILSNDISIDQNNLNHMNVPVVKIERGGDVTYHGPGQLIAYPIINLKKHSKGIKSFVISLEEIMIKTAEYFGVKATRNSLNHGIWVKNRKLGSIGIAVKRDITFHGLALNVNNDLSNFNYINPCGLKGIGITSIEKECGTLVSINKAREIIKKSFREVFNVEIEDILPGQIEDKIINEDKIETEK